MNEVFYAWRLSPNIFEAAAATSLTMIIEASSRFALVVFKLNIVRLLVALADSTVSQRFEGEPPARVTIGVASLPLGAVFEIDAIAAQ